MRALGFALACLLVCACSTEEPVSEAEKALVLRAADLAAYGYRFENAETLETFTKTRQFDGSSEITYRFQSPEGERKVLFLHVSVKVATKESDAALNQGAEKIGLLIGFKKTGVEERELADTGAGKLSLLVKDERPIGNIFTASDGVKTYLLVMSGLYFDDPALWRKVIGSKMEQFRRYSPERKT